MESRALLSAVGGLDALAAEVATANPKSSVTYPVVAGAWHIAADVPSVGMIEGTLQITQKNGKITGDANLGDGVTLHLKGKINAHELTHIKGKATVNTPLPGFAQIKAPFELDLSNNDTHFMGTARSKIGEIALNGDLLG